MPYIRSPKRLIQIIESRGWSNSQAARELGIPRTTLIGIRNGRHAVGLRTMEAIEERFPEYTRDWLFPREQAREDHSDAAAATAAG